MKNWGGQLGIRPPPIQKLGGRVPPPHPPQDRRPCLTGEIDFVLLACVCAVIDNSTARDEV